MKMYPVQRDEHETVVPLPTPRPAVPAVTAQNQPPAPPTPPTPPPAPKPDQIAQPSRDLSRSPAPVPVVHKDNQRAMDPPPIPYDRRHTIGTSAPHTHPTSSFPSRSESSKSSLSSLPRFIFGGHELSPSDQEIATRLGMQHSIQQIAQNHGFQYDIAYGVWQEVGNLKETDEVLKDMREAAQRQAEKRLQYRRSKSDEVASAAMQPNGSASSSEYNLLEAQHRFTSRTPVLKYTPVDTPDPEYQPPSDSRAALFARLAGEGRIEEAKRRDHNRRKSGIMPAATPHKSA